MLCCYNGCCNTVRNKCMQQLTFTLKPAEAAAQRFAQLFVC